jgi:alpha-glucosidase
LTADQRPPAWWRNAVFYEIYVRSFADSDGDGLGDLPGIRARLPYLRGLGVDAVWLTPFYPSPGADHGYDVADYVDVDPRFGTLGDFDGLVADAHGLGLRVVVDVVPNHTSSEHPWFRNALADPSHPDRKRYMFRPGRDGRPPTAWTSAFGGPAWTPDEGSGEWYLHFFAPEQPDLDWHNPDVQRDFEEVLRFWLARGVDGFRIDVAQALFKDQSLPDMEEPNPRTWHADWVVAVNQPELHPLYRRWRRLADEHAGERIYVGEIVLKNQETVAQYVRPDELHLAFNFSLLWDEWDAEALRGTIDHTRTALGAVGGTPSWVLENHDVPRLPTRYGGGEEGRRRARAAALLLLALPGTAFLYQGQELGLQEVDLPAEVRQDPVFLRTAGVRKGRDGCRVPLPWTHEPPGFGFTSGRPWLPIPAEWAESSVTAQQADAQSTLALYRSALAARPRLDGAFAWRESPPGTLVFERGPVTCAVNVDSDPLELPAGELVLASDAAVRDRLPAATAAWVISGRRVASSGSDPGASAHEHNPRPASRGSDPERAPTSTTLDQPQGGLTPSERARAQPSTSLKGV